MREKRSRNRKDPGEQDQAPKQPGIARLLDIPDSARSGIPHIELSGNQEAVVDGCQGVLEYDEGVIKLTTGKMTIKFTGRGLQIKILTHDTAVVAGYIINMEFLT